MRAIRAHFNLLARPAEEIDPRSVSRHLGISARRTLKSAAMIPWNGPQAIYADGDTRMRQGEPVGARTRAGRAQSSWGIGGTTRRGQWTIARSR